MILEAATTAAIVSAAKPLVEPFVEKFVTSKLQSFAEWCKKKHKEVMIPTSEHFQEYLERLYNKYSIVNTLVFHNSQRQLKDIYVAQTLVKENRFEDDEITRIEGLPAELIKKYQKILITDTAGMGKSTIMKRMFVDLIDKGLDVVGIPMYIELNKLNKNHSILTEIQEELNSLSEEFDNDLLLKLIQTGGFVFFLDGFDEISIKDRSEVTIDVHTFISKAGNKNYYIMTSRHESGLASFGDFQSFKIQPLTKEEAFELLEKYDLSKNKELSKSLVKLLNSGRYNSIDEYLVNPLLVSLLFTAYDYNRSIPFEKHRFYNTVFEAYFEKHDNTKPIKTRDKRSGLNHDGFDIILRYVGYKCLIDIGVKFSEDSVLNIIREARDRNSNLNFSEYDFLQDLTTSVPLFCKEGTDYKWIHKSLMEYFAARFVFCDSKQDQDIILTAIYKSTHIEKYINMLDLYYDIDFKGFSKNFTLPFCKQYIQFYNDNLPSLNIGKELIEERMSYLFVGKYMIIHVPEKGKKGMKRILDHRRQLGYRFFEMSDVININELYYFGYNFYRDNDYELAYLLFVKNALLCDCSKSQMPSRSEAFKYIIDNLFINGPEHNDVFDIDINSGNESEELYNAINKIIRANRHVCYKYEAFKQEKDRIEREIIQSNNVPLIAGI